MAQTKSNTMQGDDARLALRIMRQRICREGLVSWFLCMVPRPLSAKSQPAAAQPGTGVRIRDRHGELCTRGSSHGGGMGRPKKSSLLAGSSSLLDAVANRVSSRGGSLLSVQVSFSNITQSVWSNMACKNRTTRRICTH